jgi:hypothetical protein
MKKLFGMFRKSGQSIAGNEAFVTLIQVAQEDPDVKEQLSSILRLNDFHRKSALNTFLQEMQLKQAPKEFVSAIASLLDDEIAKKALEMLTADDPDKAG